MKTQLQPLFNSTRLLIIVLLLVALCLSVQAQGHYNILTHDALGITPGGTTYPMLLSCDYANGKLYVLTISNDPADCRPRFSR
jgi:hypothetical protein